MVTRLREVALDQGLQVLGVAPAVEEVRAVFGWADSVVCAAVCYLPPESRPTENAPHGLVARFARGADYHSVLRAKLEPVAAAIRAEGGRAEVCVDTTPIPERKLAVLAGIAWRGWNGNVFVDGCGSWASLGEIVTDLKLPPDEPLDIDRCRDCGRCVRHCPTKAIVEPYVVDTSRCLSQVTQMPGLVPEDRRRLMGNRIYGCDVCQEVCPQNVGVKPAAPEFAEKRFPGAHPELVPLIGLTPEEFRERVKNSSIGWIKRARIRRNAAIVAGNLRSREAIPVLSEMLDDHDPMLRECARWALREIEAES
jgi:epoxyqueuosine reductase